MRARVSLFKHIYGILIHLNLRSSRLCRRAIDMKSYSLLLALTVVSFLRLGNAEESKVCSNPDEPYYKEATYDFGAFPEAFQKRMRPKSGCNLLLQVTPVRDTFDTELLKIAISDDALLGRLSSQGTCVRCQGVPILRQWSQAGRRFLP